eukprot:711278_1
MATQKVYKPPNEETSNDVPTENDKENAIQTLVSHPSKQSLISNAPILQNNTNEKNTRSSRKRKRDRNTFDKENEDSDISHSAPPKKKRKKAWKKATRQSKRNSKRTTRRQGLGYARFTPTGFYCVNKYDSESKKAQKKSKTIRMAKTKPIKPRSQEHSEGNTNKNKARRHSVSPNNKKANKKKVSTKLSRYFRASRKTEIEIEEFIKMVMSDKELVFIGREEILNILLKLHLENKIFIVEPLIHYL